MLPDSRVIAGAVTIPPSGARGKLSDMNDDCCRPQRALLRAVRPGTSLSHAQAARPHRRRGRPLNAFCHADSPISRGGPLSRQQVHVGRAVLLMELHPPPGRALLLSGRAARSPGHGWESGGVNGALLDGWGRCLPGLRQADECCARWGADRGRY